MDNIIDAMRQIGAKNGVDIVFDEFGACALPLRDDRVLQIQVRDEAGELDFVATLGTVPDEVRGSVFQSLLAANYYWKDTLGATLSWQDNLEQVLLSYPLPVATTDENTLETAFVNFLKLQEEWAVRLADDIAEARALLKAEDDDAVTEGDDSSAVRIVG